MLQGVGALQTLVEELFKLGGVDPGGTCGGKDQRVAALASGHKAGGEPRLTSRLKHISERAHRTAQRLVRVLYVLWPEQGNQAARGNQPRPLLEQHFE